MVSELLAWLTSAPRRLHARGVEGAELFAALLIGTVCVGGFGYNLTQLLLYGVFWIERRRNQGYWAQWPDERWTIMPNALLSFFWFVAGLWCLAVVILYPIAILRWGPHRPTYKDKPPLSLD